MLGRTLIVIGSFALLGAVAVATGPAIWDRALAPAGIMSESPVDLGGEQADVSAGGWEP